MLLLNRLLMVTTAFIMMLILFLILLQVQAKRLNLQKQIFFRDMKI